MAGGIKGITVEIGGDTAPLNKALGSVNATTASLQKELGAVNKALKFDPNNIALTSQKQQILKEEIVSTKEKLESLKSVQLQVKKQFENGDIDGGKYRAFERELEITKSKLSALKDEKNSVSVIGAAFGTVKDKIAEVTSKIAPLITGIERVATVSKDITGAGIKTVGTAVDAAGKGLTAYATGTAAAGTAVAGLTVKAASAADDINTLSTQTGLSTDQIQKFQYASEVIDVPLDTLTGSMSKLTKNMSGAKDGTGTAADAFKQLGVSVTDSNGQLRSNQDVFNDSIKALGGVQNATERDALAMSLFGKSAQDLNPLILGGADTLKVLGDSAQSSGLILSKDALNNLNKFRDGLDVMKSSSGQAGNVLAGVFAGSLTSAVSTINTALPQITGSIAGLFTGKNMASTQATLTTSLVSVANNIIIGFAAQLPTFLNGFNAVILSLITAIVAILPIVTNTILPTLIQGFTDLVNGLLPQIPILLPIIINGALTLFMGLLNGLNQIIPQLMAMLPTLIQNVSTTLINNLPLIITAGVTLLISLVKGITNSIPQLITAIIKLIPIITKALLDNLPALITAGIQLIIALAVGFPKAIPAIIKAIPQIVMAIIKGFTSINWLDTGMQIIKGIGQGLIEGVFAIGDMIKKAAGGLLNKVKEALGIHSPSKLFRDEVGTYLALGLGEGFTNGMKSVSKQMSESIPTSFDVDAKVNTSALYGGSGTSKSNNSTKSTNGKIINLNIEHFENNRDQDIQALGQQLEYYSRTKSQAVGG